MATSASSSRFESFGRKVDAEFSNMRPRVEDEAKKVIDYLNDELVPEIRRSSSQALRSASGHLARLAEHLDRSSGPRS